MTLPSFSSVEKAFRDDIKRLFPVNVPYLTVSNFPKLGLLTALRFLEWVSENPKGVVSLPTGKTPEYFISWTRRILETWNTAEGKKLRDKHGLLLEKKPILSGLHFVQIDEFYPIRSTQHNSFFHFVKQYYVRDFGLDEAKCLFINCDDIKLAGGKHFSEVFPNGEVDLS